MKGELNDEGLGLSFMVNYLAMYILTKILLQNLLRSNAPRIVLVSADLYGNAFYIYNQINHTEDNDGIQLVERWDNANSVGSGELRNWL